jgi:molecular chaperone DnaK (HSP70)
MQWFGVVAGLVVFVSAVLAALGFRGREQVVGIDLGTTFSVVALRRGDKVITLPDRFTGKPLVPSVVTYFTSIQAAIDSGAVGVNLDSRGSVAVGEGAVALRSKYPQHTIFNSKRFIGRNMSEVEADAANHPFTVTESNGSAGFSLALDDGRQPRWVSPVDVGSEVVSHLKKSIAAYMGYEMHRAIICVPAKFSWKETEATKKAFEKAGFKVMRVLEEPTAAAVAYGLHRKTGVRYTLVYDIGGGTLDTSLLYMNGRSVSVLGISGDDHLGGSDFDLVMRGLLVEKVATAQPVELAEPVTLRCDTIGLHIAAEAAKVKLSAQESVDVSCVAEDGRPRTVSVGRAEYDEACADLYKRAMKPIDDVLADQMMTPENINDVVLVGGASRMPRLRALLQKYFEGAGSKMHTDIDPDITVAYGAANIVD